MIRSRPTAPPGPLARPRLRLLLGGSQVRQRRNGGQRLAAGMLPAWLTAWWPRPRARRAERLPGRSVPRTLARVAPTLGWAALVTAVFVAPLLVATRVALRTIENDLAARNVERRVATAQLAATLVADAIGDVGQQVDALARRRGLAMGIARRDAETLIPLLSDLRATRAGLLSAGALDADGVLVARDPHQATFVGASVAQRDYLTGALAGSSWYVSEAYPAAPSAAALVVLSAAVREGGRPMGVVFTTLDTSAFLEALSPLAREPGREIMVVDRRGQLIASTNAQRAPLAPVVSPAVSEALSGRSGATTEVRDGEERAVTYVPVPPGQWALLVVDQPGVLFAAERRLERLIAVVLGLAALVAAVGGTALTLMHHYRLRQRVERSRSADRQTFLAAASHDLKNPLAAIKGTAQVLRRQAAAGSLAPDRLLDRLTRIEAAAMQMGAQIDELLDLSRSEEGRPLALDRRPTDLVALTRRVTATFEQSAEGHAVRLEECVAEGEAAGLWDPLRVERVLGNLLSNAIKYSPDGGVVTVRVGLEDGARASAAQARAPGANGAAPRWGVVTVTDQGIGIPADDLPHIFDQF